MKMTVILLTAFSLQVTAKVFSQTVTFSGTEIPLKKFFNAVEKQTGYVFFYEEALLRKTRPVTLNVKDAPLTEVLEYCLKDQPISFIIQSKTIAIIEKPKPSVTAPANKPEAAIPVQLNVTGKVLNSSNEPLEGVSITIKGANNTGVTSDKNGNFSIDVPEKTVLLFSSVGYESKEVRISSGSSITVVLATAQKQVEEVVVVGYGTQSRRDITGSISKVSGNKIKDVPMQSFDQALSGRAAGVNVTIPTGLMGSPPVIRVRGINSISLSSYPLVVIDGIPAWTGNVGGMAHNNALADINPADIESMEVLKDASAAAIYGSRAAAGVLLITTKTGKTGKAKITYDGSFGYTQLYNQIEMLGAEDYTNLKNEALTNAGTPPNNTARGFYTMQDANGNLTNTSWYDYVYRTGFSHNHSLSISGANDKTRYYASFAYNDQEGIFRNNDFTRKAGRFNLEHKVSDRITIGGIFNYTNSNNNGLISAIPTEARPDLVFAASGVPRLAMILPPNVGAYTNDGAYNYNGLLGMGQGNNKTPLSFLPNVKMAIDLNTYSSQSDRIMANIHFGLKLFKGLEFKSVYGIDNLIVENKEFRNPFNGEGSRFNGAVENNINRYTRNNWQNILTYTASFAQKHNVSMLVGAEQQYSIRDGWGADRRGVADPFYVTYQGAYSTIFPSANVFGENFLQSYFTRLSYDFNKKYYVLINARRDGYSAFAPGNKFGNFAGGSLGWALSEEDFFTNSGISKVVNSLKLRLSYGEVGNNQGIGNYAFQSFYSSGLNGNNNTLFFAQAGNNGLGWETSKKTDAGFTFGLFDNRITGEFAYYKNDVDGLVLNDPQSLSAGIPGNAILSNVGSMVNDGFEFTLNTNVISGKAFKWNTSFNFTTQRNRITALAADNADIVAFTATLAPLSILRVGESIGSFYVIRSGGVNAANGRRIFYYRDGTAVQYDHAATSSAMRWTYLDGTVAPRSPSQANDGVVIGPALPKWFGGFDNTFSYKGFDMSVLLFFSGGNYVFNGTRSTILAPTTANSSTEALNRWTKPGQETNIPRVVFGDLISNGDRTFPISENVEKGDFLKVRNIAIGYTIPQNIIRNTGITNIRVYVSAINAFTFTKYRGYDPEISANSNAPGAPSVEYNSPPMSRSLNFGINIGF
jgi:TonB-dependent starch-binding outer membrane protein SusC